ncbi:progestin and adipoQ receptor family member 4 [Malaya genurostris]|uniref:progestin and adipoQ receptor family member 4 n=1 Tax=Malaya genurostris TaxID=325434 RepID=UPI0026F3E12D|nr:progestin and adipoQ receptor family member 4 [Malaya genurostris]XP_058443517.1 progestin and adipoQ receptor family member 4 [Malaya genurostris]XP_058443518.1 progestin and adipoQ receptor family member 4 [Malaya genurostris]XP_058443519.1 progestin and adipoQ receptor family member 4 [Malaya genurostris]XP_058443520.1 progestin and adipoQ receptor family member 4 [Malaya genurostris]XP_058443521.1 progestin and adipoQ receptor family member 4 [Malaya genurostris]XP_058443522.1 progesti
MQSSLESTGVVTPMVMMTTNILPVVSQSTAVTKVNQIPPQSVPPPSKPPEVKRRLNETPTITTQGEDHGRPPLMKQLNKLLTPPDDLLQWKDMPQYLQFNPYVLTGYRPLQGVKGCLSSLFYVHNETINILTHGIPIVYILATVPAMMPWEKEYRFLSWCHLVGSVAPWCGSFLYHLFMNLERGEVVYYRLLQLDMFGIWMSQSFGALPMVTATVYCLRWPLKWFIILAYSMLCIWGLYKALTASSPWQRRLCFLRPFAMRILLTLLRISNLGGGSPTSLTHVFLQDAVSAAGGVIGAMHIPEKWFPGSVDIYLNSHNIMHVLVVMAVYSMHQATIQDIEWMRQAECSGSNRAQPLIIDPINGSHLEL